MEPAKSFFEAYGPYAFGTGVFVVIIASVRLILGSVIKDVWAITMTLRETSVLLNQALDKARALAGEAPKLRIVKDSANEDDQR